MTGFHEVRFPDRIAVGAVGGPAFSTTVIATASGYEQRNVNWAEARGRWNHHRRGHLQHRTRGGVVVTADFEFDVPVRFDADEQQLLATTALHHDWTAIPIVELRL